MSAPALKAARLATLEDLLAIPEEARRHALIDGSLVEKQAATGEHGQAQFNLSTCLTPFRRRKGGCWPGGWWFATEVDVYFDPANTFRPDVTGWRRDRVPERPRGVPIMARLDWICEILSTTKRHDLIKKKRIYHQHQVPHYWIVDPEQETLAVHRWTQDGYNEILMADRGEQVRAEPFDAILLSVGVLFGDDEDDEPAQKDEAVSAPAPRGQRER